MNDKLIERLRAVKHYDARNMYDNTELVYEAADALEAQQARIATLQKLVDAQAEDEGLWFVAETAPEAYLQQELRRLHAAVEACKDGE